MHLSSVASPVPQFYSKFCTEQKNHVSLGLRPLKQSFLSGFSHPTLPCHSQDPINTQNQSFKTSQNYCFSTIKRVEVTFFVPVLICLCENCRSSSLSVSYFKITFNHLQVLKMPFSKVTLGSSHSLVWTQ